MENWDAPQVLSYRRSGSRFFNFYPRRLTPVAPLTVLPRTPVVSTSTTVTQMPVANMFIAVPAPRFTLIRVASTFIPVTQHGIPVTHPGIRVTQHGGGVSHAALGFIAFVPKNFAFRTARMRRS